MTQHDTIIILDYGSQYNQLIARRLREQHFFCELYPWDIDPETVMAREPKGFILSGGPNSVYDPGAPVLPDFVKQSGKPVLGICYGMQLLAHHFGGTVEKSQKREYGSAELELDDPANALFAGWERSGGNVSKNHRQNLMRVWMSHGDKVARLPDGYRAIAHTDNAPFAVMANERARHYAVQFHPEVVQTTQGAQLLVNFARNICGCVDDWLPANIVEDQIAALRQQIGAERVLLGLSGGVDSTVTAVLLQRAVGNRLTCIFVDHGLLRKGEAVQVIQKFGTEFGLNIVAVNAIEEFLDALSGVTDPEAKRRIIGELFIRVFEREAARLGEIAFLAQGTIYPDVIESAGFQSQQAQLIKTHHNVAGLPADLNFKLVEPLRMLFKDEVRRLGEELGLPDELIWRQPFPGPGLAIRCLGEVTWDRLERLRQSDAIFLEVLADADLLRDGTQQSFAVLLPVRSVGVMGDGRTYEEVIALRAVSTEDFMTADWARLPHDILATAANRIVNEVPGVNRVVYDITSKPPGTIEWE